MENKERNETETLAEDKSNEVSVTSGQQLEIELGPAAKGSIWKLPSDKILARSGTQDINENLVEERGRVLERALAAHGVETRLVGMVVGPTVTRYELELGEGESLKSNFSQQGYCLCHGVSRCSNSCSYSWETSYRNRSTEQRETNCRTR